MYLNRELCPGRPVHRSQEVDVRFGEKPGESLGHSLIGLGLGMVRYVRPQRVWLFRRFGHK